MGELEIRFGRLVAARRRELRLTQDQLAEKSGISIDMVSKIEGGRTGARFPSIQKLAQALDVDASALFATDTQANSRKALQNVVARIARLSDEELAWLDQVVAAALRPRPGRGRD